MFTQPLHYTDGMTTTFPPSATPISHLPTKTENPTQNTDSNNRNSFPLPKAAFIAVIAIAVASCLALTLCSGVITQAAIQREVGRRKHRRKRRRERQRHPGTTRNLQGNQQRRIRFAMRANEAYEVTPYNSATDLGQLPSYLETSDVYYEDITPFTTRMSQTITTSNQ